MTRDSDTGGYRGLTESAMVNRSRFGAQQFDRSADDAGPGQRLPLGHELLSDSLWVVGSEATVTSAAVACSGGPSRGRGRRGPGM